MRPALFFALCVISQLMAGGAAPHGQDKSSGAPAVKEDAGRKNLLQFLDNPLDLVEYKKLKGIANNGAATKPAGTKTYFRPAERGFYYEYFNFIIFGQERSGDSVPRESLGDVVIVVYKFGQVVGDYYDKREVLIEVGAKARDYQLKQANLVGLETKAIADRFGADCIRKDDLLVYQANRRVLVLATRSGKVEWFRFVRINFDIRSAADIPAWLTQY